MLKLLQKNILFSLLSYLLLCGLLLTLLNKSLALATTGYSELWTLITSAKSPGQVFNNPLFWDSPGGIFIRFGLEILLTSLIIYLSLTIIKQRKRLADCIFIVLVAHFVFVLQIVAEYLYLKFNSGLLVGEYAKELSLFSVQYFLGLFSIKLPVYLNYFSQVIGLFEIAYWFILSWILSRVTGLSYSRSVKVIFSGYVPALLIWLLFVSFMLLLNS